MRRILTVLLAGALSAAAQPAAAAAPGWNQWRGPLRTGEAFGSEWPDNLASTATSWRVDLGKGYAGPVVSESAVFVAETLGRSSEGVRAYDRQSGRELWSASWPGSGSVPFFARRNGDWIRSTPAFDGESLFVGGMEEVLRRIDAATGEILWSVDFPERFSTPVPDFGFASSPLLDGDSLYVQAANSIVRIDKSSGRTLWRSLVTETGISRNGAFSSPVLATLAGHRHLLIQSRHTLYGVDPETGGIFWEREVPNFRGMNILTPTVWKDSILTSSYRNLTHLFTVRLNDASRPTLEETWTYKSPGYMSSPIVIDGHAYLHLGNGRLTCLDLRSGESRWTTTPLGDYWSLAFQGDRILALNEVGELLLLRANPQEPEIMARLEISDQPTWGHLAVDGGQLFVRELEGLRVLELAAAPIAVPSG